MDVTVVADVVVAVSVTVKVTISDEDTISWVEERLSNESWARDSSAAMMALSAARSSAIMVDVMKSMIPTVRQLTRWNLETPFDSIVMRRFG